MRLLPHDLRQLFKQLYRWYRKKLRTINRFLLGLICILALVLFWRDMIAKYIPTNIDELEKFTRLFRDIVSIIAIFVAGLWSYYHFLKGRTFKPKAKILITLQEISASHGIAIIRFKVVNTGKTKLTSLRGHARYFIGETKHDETVFIQKFLDEDILRHYREPDRSLSLEPGDEINIDTSIVIKNFAKAILMIKSVFEVNEWRSYKENAIFCLENQGGYS